MLYIYSTYEIYNSKDNIMLEGRCNQFNIMNLYIISTQIDNRGNVYSCIKNTCFKVSTGWTWAWEGEAGNVSNMAVE